MGDGLGSGLGERGRVACRALDGGSGGGRKRRIGDNAVQRSNVCKEGNGTRVLGLVWGSVGMQGIEK